MTEPQPETPFVKSNSDLISAAHRFSHEAMATTFEVFILHPDTHYAEQAAWAAFDELDRLEQQLSRFIENSDISRINILAANQPLQLGLAAFECLQLSARIHTKTNGAFDITVGTLMDCWPNNDKTIRSPSKEQLNLARRRTGMHLIELNEPHHTVQLLTCPVRIDLGGIGKGYAIDKMAELLGDWSIDTALISGGYSSALALDAPPGKNGWPVTLSNPAADRQTLARLHLENRALSGSGLRKGLHIIDPHTAQPVKAKRAAWSSAPTAAAADALSTAFMVMSPEQIKQYCERHSDVLAMIIVHEESKKKQEDKILHFGQWKKSDLR